MLRIPSIELTTLDHVFGIALNLCEQFVMRSFCFFWGVTRVVRHFCDKGDWKCFGGGRELWLYTGVLLKDKQKLDGFRSTLNTEFLKHSLWFVRRPLQTSEFYCVWNRVSCVMLQLPTIFTSTGLRLPSCLYRGLPQFDGQCEPTKWYWSVFSKYDSISTVSFAGNPRYSLHHFGHTGNRTHPTSNDWYQLLRSVLKAQW